jgi:hypothetical protein
MGGWGLDDEADPKWHAAATRAVMLEPNSEWAKLTLAQRYVLENDFARYASELQRAADLAGDNAALMAPAGSSSRRSSIVSWSGWLSNPTVPSPSMTAAKPPARQRDVGALANGFATADLHHQTGQDRQAMHDNGVFARWP